MGCGYVAQLVQERTLGKAVRQLQGRGIIESADSMRALTSELGNLRTKFGFRVAKGVVRVLRLLGLSPGSITLFLDTEVGWLVEARTRPGAPPVYHYVDDDTALDIIEGKLTHELEERLMTPTEPVGA